MQLWDVCQNTKCLSDVGSDESSFVCVSVWLLARVGGPISAVPVLRTGCVVPPVFSAKLFPYLSKFLFSRCLQRAELYYP